MSAETEPLAIIPKGAFTEAKWLGKSTDTSSTIPPRWKGYSAYIEGNGETHLYPLRVSNAGEILPHVYKTLLEEQGKDGKALDSAHMALNSRYDLHHSTTDNVTDYFRLLLSYDLEDEELVEAGITASVQDAFEKYEQIREQRRIKSAQAFSDIISKLELYVVAFDFETNGYLAPLRGIVNVRDGNQMRYEALVQDQSGNSGILPKELGIGAGISARAA